MARRMTDAHRSPGAARPTSRRVDRAPVGWYVAWTWLGAVVVVAVFAPLLPLADPLVPDYGAAFSGITPQHWLGGDSLGRDIFSRVAHGARASLRVGICAVRLGALTGGFLLMLAAYFSWRSDRVSAFVIEAVLAVQCLAILIAVLMYPSSS